MVTAWARPRLRPELSDRLVAAGLALWALFDVPWWWRPPGHGGSFLAEAGTVGLAAAQSVPFLWRRRWPPVVLAVTAAAFAAKLAAGLNLWSAGAAMLTAAYGLGGYGSVTVRKFARVGVGAAVVAALVGLQLYHGNHAIPIGCALLGTALALGEVTAAHADLVANLARQAQEQERASMARDIHDVVAHQLSAIAVQAGAARFAAAEDPQAAVRAVAAIERGARAGLAELNTLVRRLRQAGGPDQDGDQTLAASRQPTLRDVPGLIERARESGLRAELLIDGRARTLAGPVELAGYRVVQEGLTNAIRHAAGGRATVSLRYGGDGIVIEIADDGAAQATPDTLPVRSAMAAHGAPGTARGGGAGLAGLSERASLLGGTLEAGPGRPGFVVRAFLPSPAGRPAR